MKLTEIINFLVNPGQLDKLYQLQALNVDSEAILIYMEGMLDLESEVILFEIEETEDDLVFDKEEMSYIQLFPLDYAVDLIETDLYLLNKGYSNLEIAERLLEYRKKDA